MKAHEKIHLEKDENNTYKYDPEYYDYSFWKIKDILKEMLDIFNKQDYVTRRAFNYMWARKENKFIDLEECILWGDSPIEQLFYQCFMFVCEVENIPLSLIPQYHIEINDKMYIADFSVYTAKPIKAKFLIECDGHEYHSSKQQIAHDNQRQRDLENEGYIIIRFSGSEIYKDVVKCVYEALKRINLDI